MTEPRALTVHLCGECPWYSPDRRGVDHACVHPDTSTQPASPSERPPVACPLRERPAQVMVEKTGG
jgi:hypothetical protein